jgi:DNA-directed RNA polymerase subunit RPC12/RpoP
VQFVKLINRIKRAIEVLCAPEPITESLPNADSKPLPDITEQSAQPWNHPPTLSAQPGIQCPRCQHRIEVSIPVLLSGMPIYCQNCSLELTINREKSADSIDAMNKLHNNFEKASEMLDKAKGQE